MTTVTLLFGWFAGVVLVTIFAEAGMSRRRPERQPSARAISLSGATYRLIQGPPTRATDTAWVLRRWKRKSALDGAEPLQCRSALKTRARAVLRRRLPTASALPVNELAPDRDRSGAAGTGFENGAPSALLRGVCLGYLFLPGRRIGRGQNSVALRATACLFTVHNAVG